MRYEFLRFPGGKPKAVTFSYDDGCRDDIRLAQIANSYGIKCTFNINSGFIAKNPNEWHLTADEMRYAQGKEASSRIRGLPMKLKNTLLTRAMKLPCTANITERPASKGQLRE